MRARKMRVAIIAINSVAMILWLTVAVLLASGNGQPSTTQSASSEAANTSTRSSDAASVHEEKPVRGGGPTTTEAPPADPFAGCESDTALGATCRVVTAIERRDPLLLGARDRQFYREHQGLWDELRGFDWSLSKECVLEGDVTMRCSASAWQGDEESKPGLRIFDFQVVPADGEVEAGLASGVTTYTVADVGEYHQE